MASFAALAVGCALTMWACGTEEVVLGPCDSIYQGLCGIDCGADFECANGLHCSGGLCTAECSPDHACDGDGVCSPSGRCGGGSGGAGGSGQGGFNPVGTGGGNTGGSGQGGDCGSVDVSFEPQIPTVLLMIDQSGSMSADFNGQPRWNVVYDALMDSTNGVVKSLETQVRFGLALYTFDSGTCPNLVEVTPPSLNNHSAIDAVYSMQSPLSNTPTGDSISALTPALASFAEPGPKLIILATDGDPDRCEDPDAHDEESKNEVIAAVTDAYSQDIQTVIIAVGDQVSDNHQQDVANAGAGLPPPTAYPCTNPMACAPTYEPATQQGLIDAFTDIINGQRTCVFSLDGEVIPGKECDGEVLVNSQSVPCNDPNGWQLNGASEIEFLGTTCDTIMTDVNVSISASFPCNSIVPPPD